MDAEDVRLLTRVGEKDRAAFAEFYDRHAPRVYGLLLRMIPSRADADEVLQEVFWTVWKKSGQYDAKRGSPLTWLFLIARSRAKDCLRRRKRTVTEAIELMDAMAAVVPGNALDGVAWREAAERARSALESLPEEQHWAIRSAFYDGLSHQEIAERDHIPLGTVKTRIRQGMMKLRAQLG